MTERGLEYLLSDSKRRLDVVGGIAIAGALLPAMALTGAISMADTRSYHPFFRQQRVGVGGKLFEIIKFRTLAKDKTTEAIRTFGAFDPRASKIGRLIRQTGIDEIPQLVNIIKGDMSLVGPRPLVPQDLEFMADADPKLFVDWYYYYKAVRPGLVGPGQILRHNYLHGKLPELYRESMRQDIDYFERASLGGDIALLARTPLEMFRANVNVIDNTADTYAFTHQEAA